MIVLREICKCDRCGFEWLPAKEPKRHGYPLQCPNRDCRTRHWNDGGADKRPRSKQAYEFEEARQDEAR